MLWDQLVSQLVNQSQQIDIVLYVASALDLHKCIAFKYQSAYSMMIILMMPHVCYLIADSCEQWLHSTEN